MKKIVLLPLDERPCNYVFPYKLFDREGFKVIGPSKLGDKKTPANAEDIMTFLRENCADADYLVLSIDTLLFGGLIPSRLHYLDKSEVQKRLALLKELKKENSKLKVYAFQCIMRCPKYSSSDEEPDYYGICGEQIHNIGVLEHKSRLGLCDKNELNELQKAVKKEYIDDYLNRRKFNLEFNIMTLDYIREGYIDFLILPQDDSAEYGFTAMDQEVVNLQITSQLLKDKVFMYPGADEITLTLLSKVMNELHGKVPKIYVKYASIKAPFLIPAYEDRPLGESIKYHIMAAGCTQVNSVAEADLILALTAPANEMQEANNQPVNNMNYRVERNITELLFFVEDLVNQGKPVTIGDNAYANGADLELIGLLNKRNLLMKLAGYAGWNTSANTIGTAISEGIQYLYFGDTKEHRDFLALRYIEDAGYCSVVRKFMNQYELKAMDMNYFDVKEPNGIVSRRVNELLNVFIAERLTSISENITIDTVFMPWKRMFEVGLEVSYRE